MLGHKYAIYFSIENIQTVINHFYWIICINTGNLPRTWSKNILGKWYCQFAPDFPCPESLPNWVVPWSVSLVHYDAVTCLSANGSTAFILKAVLPLADRHVTALAKQHSCHINWLSCNLLDIFLIKDVTTSHALVRPALTSIGPYAPYTN